MVENLLKKNVKTQRSQYVFPLSTEPTIDINKLKAIKNVQHSAIALNNPELDSKTKPFSIIDELKNKFTKRISNVPKEFDTMTQSVDSPRSIRSFKSFKSEQPKIRQKFNPETFDDYFFRLEKNYPIFKRNHYHIHPLSMNTISKKNTQEDEYREIKVDESYNEYFKENYKLKDDYFNLGIDEIFKFSENLTEKCGDLDFQMNILLSNSKRLFNYIIVNYQTEENIDFLLGRVKKMKEGNKKFKKQVIMNSLKMIKLGIKKKNLIRIIEHIQLTKYIKNNVNILGSIVNEITKRNDFSDLFMKVTNSMNLMKHRGNIIKILKKEEDIMKDYLKVFSDQICNFIVDLAFEFFEKTFTFKEIGTEEVKTRDLNTAYYQENAEKFNFDFRFFTNSAILSTVFDHIQYNDLNIYQDIFNKIKEFFSFGLKTDHNIYINIKGLLSDLVLDAMVSLNESLDKIFEESYKFHKINSVVNDSIFNALNPIDRALYILILFHVFQKLFISYESILKMMENDTYEFFLSNKIHFTSDNNENQLKNIFQHSRENTYNELLQKNFKYMKLYLDSSLKVGLNTFLYSYNFIHKSIKLDKNITTTYSSNFTLLREKNISDEINKFFSESSKLISEEIDQENWKDISIPGIYQKFVNFIESSEINHLKNINIDELILILNRIDDTQDESSLEFISTSDGNTYKIVKSSLIIIKFLFDISKLILWLDSYLYEEITQKLIKTIKEYIYKCTNLILESEAFKLKNLKINQNNICLFISTMIFLKTILNPLFGSIRKINQNSVFKYIFEDLESYQEKIIEKGKKKLLQICNDQISQSIQGKEIDWFKDDSNSVKSRVENIFDTQKSVYNICTAVKKYLPNQIYEEIGDIVSNTLINTLQKFISNVHKAIESKNNAKHFRYLLGKINKLIESINPKEKKKYMNSIEELVLKYAPKSKVEPEEKK